VFNDLTAATWVDAVLSPDGKFLGMTGCYAEDTSGDCIDYRLLVRDLASGTLRYSVPAGQTGLAISPDGTQWAFMGPDYAILLVDVQSGSVVTRLYGHNSWVVALTFDPSGTRLLSSAFYDNNRIYVWDVETGEVVRQITVGANVWTLFYSARGDYFFSLDISTSIGASEHVLNRWRVEDTLSALLDWTQQNRIWRDFTCAERIRFSILPLCSSPIQSDTDAATAVALAPSRTPFPTVVRERTPYPRTPIPTSTHTDTPTLTPAPTITPTPTTYVYNTLYDVQWSPDGRRILAGEAAGYVIVWDIAERKELYRLSGHSAQSDFDGIRGRWSPDSKQIATYDGGQVQLWDAASGELRVTLNGHMGDVRRVVWSPDGALLASLGEDNTVRVWDAIVGSLRFVLSGHSASVTDAVWLGDARLATASLDGGARIWDTNTGLTMQSLLSDGGAPLYGLAISPDGTQLLTTGASATAIVWSLFDGSLSISLTPVADGSLVYYGEWSTDGSRILLHTVDAPPSVWDAANGQRLYALEGHNGFITQAQWSPDGTAILTAGVDGTIRTWDGATGAAGRTLDAHSIVWSVAYSPDGSSIVSTADDGTIRLWNVRLGREMQFIFPPAAHSTSTATAITDLNAVLLALR
jgi:WD40 repeat protein